MGLDKKLKVSTTAKRTHSLFRQGLYWYGAIPAMPEEWLRPLMEAFGRLLSDHPNLSKILAVIGGDSSALGQESERSGVVLK